MISIDDIKYLGKNVVGIGISKRVASDDFVLTSIRDGKDSLDGINTRDMDAVIWLKMPNLELRNKFDGVHVPLYSKFLKDFDLGVDFNAT